MKTPILNFITDRLPAREILDDGTPYMMRFYVATLFGWRIYLHHFTGSDPDRGLHDHPWRKSFSIILRGKYLEETRFGPRWVKWFNFLTGDSFHRVVLPPGTSCWTLFCHSTGDAKPWGFLRSMAPGGQNNASPCVWQPYQYAGGEKQYGWWKTALRGRELRATIALRNSHEDR